MKKKQKKKRNNCKISETKSKDIKFIKNFLEKSEIFQMILDHKIKSINSVAWSFLKDIGLRKKRKWNLLNCTGKLESIRKLGTSPFKS